MDKNAVFEKIIEHRFDIDEVLATYGMHDMIMAALEDAYGAGVESVKNVKEEHVPALLKNNLESKRARELAGIPHKGNYL